MLVTIGASAVLIVSAVLVVSLSGKSNDKPQTENDIPPVDDTPDQGTIPTDDTTPPVNDDDDTPEVPDDDGDQGDDEPTGIVKLRGLENAIQKHRDNMERRGITMSSGDGHCLTHSLEKLQENLAKNTAKMQEKGEKIHGQGHGNIH